MVLFHGAISTLPTCSPNQDQAYTRHWILTRHDNITQATCWRTTFMLCRGPRVSRFHQRQPAMLNVGLSKYESATAHDTGWG